MSNRPWKPSLSISRSLTGGSNGGARFLAVESVKPDDQLHGYLDLVHWLLSEPLPGEPAAQLRLPAGSAAASLEPIASLEAARVAGPPITVTVDGATTPLEPPDFSAAAEKRAVQLRERENDEAHPPAVVLEIESHVRDVRFVTYRNLSSPKWFGKVGGLRVCSFNANGGAVVLRDGEPGEHAATTDVWEGFKEAVGSHKLPFSRDDVASLEVAAAALNKLIASRREGRLAETYREGPMEADVLAAAISLDAPSVGRLEVASRWGQFPTLWSAAGAVRELDVLMRHGGTPWAVELKHHSGGAGSYYRHAVGQAVLYRAFIKEAVALHPWFAERQLDATCCEAAVAVTKHPGKDWELRREQLKRLAEAFGVHVIVIDGAGADSA